MKDWIRCLKTTPHGGRMFIDRDVLVRGAPFLSSRSCEETNISGDVTQLGMCIEMLIYGFSWPARMAQPSRMISSSLVSWLRHPFRHFARHACMSRESRLNWRGLLTEFGASVGVWIQNVTFSLRLMICSHKHAQCTGLQNYFMEYNILCIISVEARY